MGMGLDDGSRGSKRVTEINLLYLRVSSCEKVAENGPLLTSP